MSALRSTYQFTETMEPRTRKILRVGLFPGVFAALLGWAFFIEPNRLVLRRETIAVPNLPPMRVALLSDLHAGARFIDRAKIRHAVELVNAEHPDLILLLGDFLNNGRHPDRGALLKGGFPAPEEVTRELARLRALVGVFTVLGNHDWWFDGARMTRALESAGITVLENQSKEISVRGHRLWLVGLADAMTRAPDIDGALAAVPKGAAVLALTHSPDLFPDIPARIGLTVAGHTHGGQVSLPLIGSLIVPSRFGQRYAAGHVVEGERHLFVTTGIGTSLYPVRFGIPPEIVILTIE
jgi:predicted MPP superfamily phosphohydrolase